MFEDTLGCIIVVDTRLQSDGHVANDDDDGVFDCNDGDDAIDDDNVAVVLYIIEIWTMLMMMLLLLSYSWYYSS